MPTNSLNIKTEIASAMRSQLNWSQYKLLLIIDNEDKKEYYINESIKNCWTGRQL